MTASQWLTVALAGLVTFGIRASFLVAAERMTELPQRVTTVLRMIPPAAIAAIAIPAILRPDGAGTAIVLLSPLMVGAVVSAIVARWKHDIGLSLGAGLVAVMAVTPLLG